MAESERRMPMGLVVIAALALAQGVLVMLRAVQWIQIGSDLIQQGLLLLPMIGAMAFARAVVVATIALLYGLLALGLLARKAWARPLGFAIVLVNVILVGLALPSAEAPGLFLLWAIVPVVIAAYLLTPAGRRALSVRRA